MKKNSKKFQRGGQKMERNKKKFADPVDEFRKGRKMPR